MGMSNDCMSHELLQAFSYMLISCFHVGTTGSLEEVDQKRVVFSLIEEHHQVLIQGQALPLQLISSFVNAYPEFSLFFQQSR